MNYQTTIKVKAAPEKAYNALTTGFEHWWTTPDSHILKIGDTAKFGFSDKFGYWTFKATELTPSRIVLDCVDALHIHEGFPKEIETEWLGTRLIWTIRPEGSGSTIELHHEGLTPDLYCYDICATGWDMFFVSSLQAYLDTGKGRPFSAENQS